MDFGTMPHTSFIPKKPITTATPSMYARKTIPLFTLITVVIFIVSLAAAGGTFLYKQFLEKQLEQKKEQLARDRAKFEPATIEELKRLDVRIEHAKTLLANHIALTSFFDLLEASTLTNVQFKSLNLQTSTGEKMSIELKGTARNYAAVALQSDVFAAAKGVHDILFSDLSLDQSGNVLFTVKATLDPDLFRYETLLLPAESASEQSSADAPQNQAASGNLFEPIE